MRCLGELHCNFLICQFNDLAKFSKLPALLSASPECCAVPSMWQGLWKAPANMPIGGDRWENQGDGDHRLHCISSLCGGKSNARPDQGDEDHRLHCVCPLSAAGSLVQYYLTLRPCSTSLKTTNPKCILMRKQELRQFKGFVWGQRLIKRQAIVCWLRGTMRYTKPPLQPVCTCIP